jgi:hypothetical protein
MQAHEGRLLTAFAPDRQGPAGPFSGGTSQSTGKKAFLIMSRFHGFRLRSLLVSAAVLVMAGGARADELPLTRVVLSTAGIAQFTRSGPVTAGSTVDIAVRFDQVDDILKSLTVFDKAGAIGPVSLPGQSPLVELFRDLPFGPDALDSSRALLDALVGSEVEIAGPVNAKGRVFRVEDQQVALPGNGGSTTRHRLTLMTETGLVQAVLEDVTMLRFLDPQVRAQIERALAGVTENRAKDRRKLSIGFLGEGTRNAAISYMAAAPVWKTAYRLVLPRDSGAARLQGWAVVENLTGGDWNDIELVLVSGNPVALRQPLYTAVFADRIEVPVTTAVRLKPHADDADDKQQEEADIAVRMAAPASAARPSSHAPPRILGGNGAPAPAALASSPPTLGAAANAAEAEEASTQLLYRFPGKVSLATGHTMMVPFVDREVPAARTWLYQPETAARHPLAAVRLRNDGESGLPPGIVTAYEGAADGSTNFVGDAQLPLLSKGAVKFVTFALDSKTDIRREDKGVQRTQLGKAVNGVLTLTTRSRRAISYEITAPSDEDRQIVIEEARADGWKPAGETSVEETPTRFRHTVAAPKGQVTKSTLVLERTDSETVTLTALAPDDMLARIRGLQNEGTAVKDAVAKLGAIVSDINKARAQRTQLDAERKKIVDDQSRIRQNLQSVGQGSDLGRRYLDTLKSQEDRLAEIARSDATLENEIAARRQSAEELAHHLTL